MNPEDTTVSIPKFKIRHRTSLKEEMLKLGVSDLFSEEADLSGISNQPLSVTDAVQDAFIEVTEEGTEAAAATTVLIGLRTAKRNRQFFADHPFVFMVYDFNENIPLFLGKLQDPSSSGSVVLRIGASSSSGPENQNAVNLNPVVTSTTPPPQIFNKPPPQISNRQNCERIYESFPNALQNSNLCDQAQQQKILDWLRQFRSVCESSKDLMDSFKVSFSIGFI